MESQTYLYFTAEREQLITCTWPGPRIHIISAPGRTHKYNVKATHVLSSARGSGPRHCTCTMDNIYVHVSVLYYPCLHYRAGAGPGSRCRGFSTAGTVLRPAPPTHSGFPLHDSRRGQQYLHVLNCMIQGMATYEVSSYTHRR